MLGALTISHFYDYKETGKRGKERAENQFNAVEDYLFHEVRVFCLGAEPKEEYTLYTWTHYLEPFLTGTQLLLPISPNSFQIWRFD